MPKFLLAIDIGNTATSLGVIKEHQVLETYNVLTGSSTFELKSSLNQILPAIKKKFPLIEEVVICSVPPRIKELLVITKLNTVFMVSAGVAEAVKALQEV